MSTPISRRRFAGLSVAASALFLTKRNARADSGVEILETRTISPQVGYYHGWPTLTRLGNGDLIVVWSGRREAHVCPFGTVEMMRSRDGGGTWSFPRTVHDGPLDDRDAGILETATGTLIVICVSRFSFLVFPGGCGHLWRPDA